MYLINKFFRLSHKLYKSKILFLPDLICLGIRLFYSADLHYQAEIGRNVVFSHTGLGIIVHPRAVIGDFVTIGAHTVIGCNLRSLEVPKIGSYVFIGPGAKLLGELEIGNKVMIGANSVVLSSVPDRAVVAGAPAKVIRYLTLEEIDMFWPQAQN